MTAKAKPKFVYQAIAEAFRAEDVDTYFALLGDGNMHWSATMTGYEGMRAVQVRHEHAAVAMAMGYAEASGKVGVSSVTCGPGFTQIMTALAGAAHSHIPLVVFAGEPPMKSSWYNQTVDQAALTGACGARYIAMHAPSRVYEQVREAFHIARVDRRPVVLAMPFDLQRERMPAVLGPLPSSEVVPQPLPNPPHPNDVAFLAEKLCGAKHPIIIAGRGAIAAGAVEAIRELADRCGALVATTLPARGLFDDHAFSVGFAGGFASDVAREAFAAADLVVSFGARLTYFTADGGALFPDAYTIQVDMAPRGFLHGRRVADRFVRADALLTATAVLDRIGKMPTVAAEVRTETLARRIASMPAHSAQFEIPPGTIDPRDTIAVLDDIIPKDWDVVSGAGHSAYFHTQMRGRHPRNYHIMREFGAVGNGLCFAIGVAMATNDGKVVVFDGDGGLMMHVQELDTLLRYNIRILFCCFNDGGFGADFHRLLAEGVDDSGPRYGRTDLDKIARGFGVRGRTIRSLDEFATAFAEFAAQDVAEVWNIQVADTVISPDMLRVIRAQTAKRLAEDNS